MANIKISDMTMKQAAEGFRLSFKEKIELSKLLDKLGVSVIELEGIANPKVELSAFHQGTWIRVAGELAEDGRVEAKKSMLDAYPDLRNMYEENDSNTQVFYFKNAVATFSSFGAPSDTVVF